MQPTTFWRPRRGASVIYTPLAFATIAMLASACHDGVTAPTRLACDDDTQVTISTSPSSASAAPSISWSPDCVVSFVVVVDSVSYDAAWGIRTSAPALASPQRMYQTPRGAYALGVSHALQAGVSYVVMLGVRHTDPTTGTVGEQIVASTAYRP